MYNVHVYVYTLYTYMCATCMPGPGDYGELFTSVYPHMVCLQLGGRERVIERFKFHFFSKGLCDNTVYACTCIMWLIQPRRLQPPIVDALIYV